VRTKVRGCVFCEIVAQQSFADVVQSWPDALAFVPLDPVTEGHVLVVPREHVADVTEDPEVSALTMHRAAELAPPDCNIITSAGVAATQSVFHLHLHIVPRHEGDGLNLPWSTQVKTAPDGSTVYTEGDLT
jgi:histidine triad (HIT) family protein